MSLKQRERAFEVERELTAIRDWSDTHGDDERDNEWPYPDRFELTEPGEGLRRAVLNRLGLADGRVELLTKVVSGGYSEYTQEDDYFLTVLVNDEAVFESSSGAAWSSVNGLVEMLDWLDEVSA